MTNPTTSKAGKITSLIASIDSEETEEQNDNKEEEEKNADNNIPKEEEQQQHQLNQGKTAGKNAKKNIINNIISEKPKKAINMTTGAATKTAKVVGGVIPMKTISEQVHNANQKQRTVENDDEKAKSNDEDINSAKQSSNDPTNGEREEKDDYKEDKEKEEANIFSRQIGKSLPSSLLSLSSGIADSLLTKKVLILGPPASILLTDVSILVQQLILLFILSYKNFDFITTHRSLPFIVVLPCVIFSFSLGFWASHKFTRKYQDEGEPEVLINSRATIKPRLVDERQLIEGKDDEKDEHSWSDRRKKEKQKDSFFLVAAMKRLSFAPISPLTTTDHSPSTDEAEEEKALRLSKALFWTNLGSAGNKRKQQQQDMTTTRSSNLMDILLKNPNFRRKNLDRQPASAATSLPPQKSFKGGDDVLEEEGSAVVGKIDLKHVNKAVSLEDQVTIDPLFTLLGMDVFLTDCPERHIWKQPLLNECGLRSKPTFVLNVLAPWANLAIYFEMPSWIHKWSDIKEEENDPEDIKALKRFLSKDDEYRNLRFKGIPAIVEAPLPIRMLKPAKEETTIDSQYTPVSWNFEDECIGKDGTKKCAILEADVDLNVSGAVRRIVGLCRKNVKKIVIDLAIIISKPEEKDSDEPSACLGLWRMHKIDLETCAVMPAKTEEENVKEVLELKQKLSTMQPVSVAAGSV